jgi:membrane protein
MKRYIDVFKQTFSEFSSDKVPRLGAALAYYTVFSIAPLLLIVIAIAGFVWGKEAASGAIYAQLRGLLGPSSAAMIEQMVKAAAKPKSGAISTIIGVVTLLLGASGVIGQLKDALNTIWDVKPSASGGIMGTVKTYLLNGAVVIGCGFLLLVSLVVDTAIAAMGKFAKAHLPGGEALWQVVQLVVSFAVITVVFALIFRILPDLKIDWRDVWFGAAFTSLLFVLGKFALGLWIAKAAAGSTYGAAGSLVAVLLWVYYAAQIVLFGGEFTQVYARKHGSHATVGQAPSPVPEREARPPVAYPPLHPVAAKSGGGGALKLAAGGVAGLILGALFGGIGAAVVMIKSVKKLITFH